MEPLEQEHAALDRLLKEGGGRRAANREELSESMLRKLTQQADAAAAAIDGVC